jgi:hypothetical protein
MTTVKTRSGPERVRTIALLGTVLATLAGTAVLAATSSGNGATTITVRLFEHDSSQANIDLGVPGDSPGDQFVVAGDTFDRKGGTRRGRLAAAFTTVSTGPQGEAIAVATFTLAGGEISTQGLFVSSELFGGKTLSFSITGGTGRYRDASGEGTIEVPNQTDARFVLTLR